MSLLHETLHLQASSYVCNLVRYLASSVGYGIEPLTLTVLRTHSRATLSCGTCSRERKPRGLEVQRSNTLPAVDF
jgi:hypothetical protein